MLIVLRALGLWLHNEAKTFLNLSHLNFHTLHDFTKFHYIAVKVQKILKGSLDSIPSPSVKIQIMDRKVCLSCKGKTLLGVVNKLFAFNLWVFKNQFKNTFTLLLVGSFGQIPPILDILSYQIIGAFSILLGGTDQNQIGCGVFITSNFPFKAMIIHYVLLLIKLFKYNHFNEEKSTLKFGLILKYWHNKGSWLLKLTLL